MSTHEDVFFSYKTSEAAEFESRINAIYNALLAAGYSVFRDTRNLKVGFDWIQGLETAIDNCKCGIVLWSPLAHTSEIMKAEAVRLFDQSKYIGVNLGTPLSTIPFIFHLQQFSDLGRWNGRADDPEWSMLVTAIDDHIRFGANRPRDRLFIPGRPISRPEAQAEEQGLPKMSTAPAKSFRLGEPEGRSGTRPNEKPARPIRIEYAYMISQRPISFREWNFAAASSTGKIATKSPTAGTHPDSPVTGVSWDEALAYIKWLNRNSRDASYRLPSESEWESAARFCASEMFVRHDADTSSAPIWEWVADVYSSDYVSAPLDGSARASGPRGSDRTARGGSYLDTSAAKDQPFRRSAFDRFYSAPDLGFRVCRSI